MLPGTKIPEGRIFIVPVAQSTFLGNWDVLGLRATGSIDYEIKDVFVPDEFTHLQIAKRANRGGDFFRIAIPGMGSICHSGFALGTGRRVLDELAELARMDPSRSALIPQPGGGESFQEQFGHAEAEFLSARAFVREAQGGIQAAVQSGRDPTTREITMARLSLNHVTTVVAEVCAFAYKYSGGIALRDSAIQRCMRDMYAGTQHASTAPTILRECGRELLGLTPGKVWGPRGLIDRVEQT
jgi:alkylation response protein AidB-like acyl-CoA dehydrogenase